MDDTCQAQVEVLTAKAKAVSAKIYNIVLKGRNARQDEASKFMFKGMVKEIKSHYDSFSSFNNEIIEYYVLANMHDKYPSPEMRKLVDDTDRYYYESLAIVESLSPQVSSDVHSQSMHSGNSRTMRASLPPIKLHQFDGNLSSWPLFKDQFKSVVHSDESIPRVEKFNLLISNLHGVPLSLVKGIPITEETYDQAWTILLDHYDSQRIMANYYLQQIVKCKPYTGKPTVASQKRFITEVCENINAFKKLKIPNLSEFILFTLAVRCLDETTRHNFEKSITSEEFPTFDALFKFVKTDCRTRELSGMNSEESHQQSYTSQPITYPRTSQNKKSFFVADKPNNKESNSSKCSGCNGPLNHSLHRCFKFRACTPQERLDLLKNWSGCKNCLSSQHPTKRCPSNTNCRECDKRHNTWLHLGPSKSENSSPSATVDHLNNSSSAVSAPALIGTPRIHECVMLGSVVALIKDVLGQFQAVRMILDSGSQFSFVTADCVSRLGLSINGFCGSISGIGKVALGDDSPKGIVECSIRSTFNENPIFHTQAVVLHQITSDLPQTPIPPSWRTKYQNYQLADPDYWKPGSVDFLLGGDLFYDILQGKPIHVASNIPKLTPTAFGLVVGGRFQRPAKKTHSTSLFASHTDTDLSKIMNKFWSVEEVEERTLISPDDEFCELFFQRTCSRSPSGRYIVALPFKQTPPDLTSSRTAAMTRFRNLESKFARNPHFKQAYVQFMDEYQILGHMSASEESAAYTIPHHAVFKSDGVSSKIRVVFDGSCKTSKGSLNDFLLPGPKLQKDIGSVLLRFRTYRYVFTADIVKMFRQILIRNDDLKYQHILWRSDTTSKLQDFTLNTITYGTTSAPWLAIRTLIKLVEDEGEPYPEASKVILNETYVDDICCGSNTLQGAHELKSQLINLLKKGELELSKWSSNHPSLLGENQQTSEPSPMQLGKEDHTIKILGLQWDANKDIFTYHVDAPAINPSKRSILSAIARIFDPLGYLSPVVCYAKIILQQCWEARVDWDQKVPDGVAEKWISFVNQLPVLDQVAISRFVPSSEAESLQIVGFCDASEQAYSAMIYLRCINPKGIRIHLLKAKSKLAPLKILTVPRLELSAALLLSRLYTSLKDFLNLLSISGYYWFSDSTVVLGWLHADPSSLKTFVGHRVAEIVETTNPTDWHHVKSADNPADCSSRGLLPSEFINHQLWESGPSWLHLPTEDWPIKPIPAWANIELPEMKDKITSYLVAKQPDSLLIPWMEKFSSFGRLVRIISFVVRFLCNYVGWPSKKGRVKFKTTHISTAELLAQVPPISVPEYKYSSLILIKAVQYHNFPLKGTILDQEKLPGHLQRLNPFIGRDGLVRVGGRLCNSNLPPRQMHPILLPGKCHLARIIIDYYHRINLHAGPSLLQCILQNEFWITSARLVVKQRIYRCATCFKLSQEPKAPFMGDLPKCRFQLGRAFQEVGVDLAGPFLIKESQRRKAALGKAYLCIFICMTSKAVHLEIVSACSTSAFLASLDRFIARRGCPSRIHSDCGTNFVGACREMKEVLAWYRNQNTSDAIEQHLTPRGIEWSFNPPASPHFGGLWEAAVKSSKSIFKRISGNTPFTFEELSTLFSRIEAILNSRPLCPLNNDPESLEALTPGHLLIGSPLIARPELPLIDVPENRLSRWQLVQQRTQHFWNRFRTEYLHHLQQRHKWNKTQTNFEVGDLVLQKTDTTPNNWILGRVQDVYPGKDHVLRVVKIKTANGIYTRPVTKLVLLRPITDPESSPSPIA